MLKPYWTRCCLCSGLHLLVMRSGQASAGSTFLETLIDDYIIPLLAERQQHRAVCTGLAAGSAQDGACCTPPAFVGTLFCTTASWSSVAQGILKNCAGRDVLPHADAAHPLFRHPHPRRCDEPVHQRYRHAAPADRLRRYRRCISSAIIAVTAGVHGPCCDIAAVWLHAGLCWCCALSCWLPEARAQKRRLLCEAADLPGRAERLYRRNDSTARRSSRCSTTRKPPRANSTSATTSCARTPHEANSFANIHGPDHATTWAISSTFCWR